MSDVDWLGLWHVLSGFVTVYVIGKALYGACFDLYVKYQWRKWHA